MKTLMTAAMMFGLLSAPAQAQDLGSALRQLFGGASAPQQQQRVALGWRHHRHHGHYAHSWRHYHWSRHASHRHATHASHHALSFPAGGRSFTAMSSYYGGGPRRFEPNTHTANGERFNQWGLTAAHRTLPMGTRLLVSHGGRSVVVRVNDRGPAAWTGRSLDVSRGAAARLGLIGPGTGAVHVTVLGRS